MTRALDELFGLREGLSWIDRAAASQQTEPTPAVLGALGAYEQLQEIGRGAQGTVYKARQPVTGRTVAIKRVGSLSGERSIARFEREVEAATRLSHPNIVTVHGAEVLDGHAVLVMEHVDGEPIDAWASRVRREAGVQAWRRIIRVGLDVCDALAHAHQRGVIHRDLKPGNVLVGADGRARVLDFGIAHVTDPFVAGPSAPAASMTFAGTPGFAPPEQLEGRGVDVRADVYSLGVLLIEMLTGTPVFSGDAGLAQLIDAVRRGVDARVSRQVRALPRDLDWVLLRATALEPGARYAAADAMGRDLLAVLEGRAVEAHPPSLAYNLRKLARRHWVGATLVATVTLAAATTLVVTLESSARVRRALADTTEALGRESEALARETQAREQAELELENQSQLAQLLRQILRAGNPQSFQGDPNLTIREAIDYAVRENLASGLNLRPEVEATLRMALGEIYWGQGVFDAAATNLARAHELFSGLYGPEDGRALEPLLFLSRIQREAGQWDQALDTQERIAAVRREQGSGPLLAQALNAVGITQRRLGLLAEAERTLVEARDTYASSVSPDNENVALVDGALTGVYGEMGRLDDARASFENAMRILLFYHPDGLHLDIATIRRHMGEALATAGLRDEAERELRRALEVSERLGTPSTPSEARTRLMLGRYLTQWGRPGEAMPLLDRALAQFESAYPGGGAWVDQTRDAIEQAHAATPR